MGRGLWRAARDAALGDSMTSRSLCTTIPPRSRPSIWPRNPARPRCAARWTCWLPRGTARSLAGASGRAIPSSWSGRSSAQAAQGRLPLVPRPAPLRRRAALGLWPGRRAHRVLDLQPAAHPRVDRLSAHVGDDLSLGEGQQCSPWLGEHLTPFFGPFRLFTSYLFLAGLGAALAALVTWRLLPALWHRLPTDQGRAHAVGAQASKGKPVAAGIIFVPVFVVVCLLVIPFDPWRLVGAGLRGACPCWKGTWTTRATGGWSELKLGVVDLAISAAGGDGRLRLQPMQLWLPLFKNARDPLALALCPPGDGA